MLVSSGIKWRVSFLSIGFCKTLSKMDKIFILAVVCCLLQIRNASLSVPEDVIESNEEPPVSSSLFEEPLMDSMWGTSLNPYIRYLGKRSNTRVSRVDDYR